MAKIKIVKKGFFRRNWDRIREMFGQISAEARFGTSGMFKDIPSLNIDKPDYDLSRAIFYASPYGEDNKGEEFIYGAAFGKPIANSTTAFTVPEPYQITCEDEKIVEQVNEWLDKNHGEIQNVVRNAIRDGDCYLLRENDDLILIPPDQIEKIIDPLHGGKAVGYDREVEFKSESGATQAIYIAQYRVVAPYKMVIKYEDKTSTKGKILEKDGEYYNEENAPDIDKEEPKAFLVLEDDGRERRRLPVVHFQNEKEPEMVYGLSEYQSCYYFMQAYHYVLENAIKNNIYNSGATPILGGIDNIQKFIEENFEKDDEGDYKIDWDPSRLLLGGKDFKADFMEAPDTTEGADRLLNILFWLICQTSETPEFVMGTAVRSSKASVSEQLPVMLRKSLRKQNVFKKAMLEIVGGFIEDYFSREIDFNLIPPEIVSKKDLKLNKEIVALLLQYGCITKETADEMLDVSLYVNDIREEIEKAEKEAAEEAQKSDVYGRTPTKEMEEAKLIKKEPIKEMNEDEQYRRKIKENKGGNK